MDAGAEKLAEAAFRHPFRAVEMAGVDAQGTLRIGFGIEAEDDLDDFAPVGACRVGVEKPDVELQMRLVISGQCRPGRRLIEKIVFGHNIPRWRDVSNPEGIVNDDFIGRMTQGPAAGG